MGLVGERVEELRRALPPRAGRNSRIGYLSIEDMAEAIGTGKSNLLSWIKGRSWPDARNRERLAELSGGRLDADYFKRPAVEEPAGSAGGSAQFLALLQGLSTAVSGLEETVQRLEARVARLEKRRGGGAARPARTAS